MKNFKEISSFDNSTYKSWKELLSSKGIKKQQKALIQGKIIVHEYFKNFFNTDIEILFSKEHGFPANLSPNTKTFLLTPELFNELNISGVDYPMLCVPIPEIKSFKDDFNFETIEIKSLKNKNTHVFLPLGDPKNLGGAIRNCLAFGADSAILLKESANPFHPLSIKASSGACFYLKLFNGPETKDLNLTLKDQTLFVLDASGTPAHEVKWPDTLFLLVGEEGQGPPENIKQNSHIISIPISDKIESLNANQALGIALYERFIR